MAGLGIPTTRALAITGSPLPVWRETPETAAIVTRVAPSFLRFGHFEHFTAQGHEAALRRLVRFAIEQHYPDLADEPHAALALLARVAERTAELVARWQAVGFCHGVLNTDNMSLLGLTLDYGPFGFMDRFSFAHVCNHSDTHGRYAYDQQPHVGLWNCAALAQALMPLIGDEEGIEAALEGYAQRYATAWLGHFRAKLGLAQKEDDDKALIDELLGHMDRLGLDFTRVFRQLSVPSEGSATSSLAQDADWALWAQRYRSRLERETESALVRSHRMRQVNPRFVLRNYLAESAIRAAQQGDFEPVAELRRVLERPFDEHPEHEAWAAEPPDWACSLTLSCSS